MQKLNTILMIVLPLIVGVFAIVELVLHFSGKPNTMNVFLSAGLAILGLFTGISNIMKLRK